MNYQAPKVYGAKAEKPWLTTYTNTERTPSYHMKWKRQTRQYLYYYPTLKKQNQNLKNLHIIFVDKYCLSERWDIKVLTVFSLEKTETEYKVENNSVQFEISPPITYKGICIIKRIE